MSNIVQYSAFSLDDVEATDLKVAELSGSDFIDIEQGETILRVLPGVNGAQAFRVTSVHYIDEIPGLEATKTLSFACPRIEKVGPCIACQKADELARSGLPHERERAKRIAANLKVYCNVVDRRQPTVVKVWGFGKKVWEGLKAIRKNPRLGGDFTNPGPDGFDVIVMREGSGKFDTKYSVAADRSPSPLASSEVELNEVLGQSKNLDNFVIATPDERIGLMWGAGPGRGHYAPAGQLAQTTARAAQQFTSGNVGAGVMPQRAAQPAPQPMPAARTAVQDAQIVGYDDDMNPIYG